MEEDDPYEALPPTTTMTTHMVAGAAAGIMEHVVMYPVDCVKVRRLHSPFPNVVISAKIALRLGHLCVASLTFP